MVERLERLERRIRNNRIVMVTTEENKLIAEFMGYETYEHTDSVAIRLKEGNEFSEELGHIHTKYHCSWDWLMPVVEKIRDMKGLTLPKTLDWLSDWLMQPVESRKQIFEAVVEFIKWYNENK